jgi:hypothetical protein
MNFIPSPPIAAGIAAGLSLPTLIMLLSHGPGRVAAPGGRFVVAALLAVAGWVVWLLALPACPLDDLLASAMIMATALLVGFTLWTLVAWGFTVSLLMTLARADRPLVFDEWVRSYTGGKDVDAFARDRLGLLLRLGLARLDREQVRITAGRGRPLARLVGLLRGVFGVPA